MSRSHRDYIDHILVEIDFLTRESTGKTEADFASSEMMQRAFSRSLEIIGEAVKNIDDDFKRQHPSIEWRKIAGMRDKLIHQYFGIDYPLVWDVTSTKILPLKERLEAIRDL